MRSGRGVIGFTRCQYGPDLLCYEIRVEPDLVAVDVGKVWMSASSNTAFRRGAHAEMWAVKSRGTGQSRSLPGRQRFKGLTYPH